MFESQLPQQNPLDPSIKSSFNNLEFNPEFPSEILSSLRNKGEFSLSKIEINNLTDSNTFNYYDNLSSNFWQPSTIEANATTSPISLTGNTKDLPLVYPVEINQDPLLIARNHSYSSEISLNSDTISGVLQQDVYLTLQKFVQSPNFEQIIQSIFGANVNPEKLNRITEQWQAGDFSKLPKIEVREESVFSTNTLGAFAGATDKIYLSQGLLNSGNTARIGDTIIEEIGHWLDKQLNFVDTPGDEGQMFTAVVRGQNLSTVQIAEIRAEDDSTTIFVDGQFLRVEQSNIVLPTITITAKDADAGETLAGQTANPGQFTLTRTGNITSSLQVNYIVGGTATNSADYNKLTNSVIFAAGSSTALINITPIDDGQFEGNETVVLTLATSTNYNLGTAKNATVNIADNDKPIITISATDINAGETLAGQTANPGQFTLTRTGNNTSALTVNYIVAGTATNSADYNKLTNSVIFAAGSSTALINITPIDDGQFEGNETVVLTLATSTNYNLGTVKNATVNIADNDKPIITISATDINAGETLAGQIANPGQFTLTRTGNNASALTVNYIVSGTATNGTDYSNLSGNATFMAGAATTLVTVIPKDDSVFEGNESVILTLATGNAYTLGNAQTATVTLTDNDLSTWNVSFINRNDSNVTDYNSYDFSRPDATVNLGWQNGFVYDSTPFETLTVDSRSNVAPIGQPKVYSSVLEVGKRYRIEASGQVVYALPNANYIADVRFYTDNNWSNFADPVGGTDIGLHSTVLGQNSDDFWGDYRSDHVYTYEIIGQGQRVDFYFNDNDFENNQGSYTVKIYRESATPPTGNTIRLNANFGERNPAPNVQSDNFAMQAWTTTRLENGKTYQVTTNSDDGTRFFVKNLATGEVTSIGSDWRIRSDGEPSMTLYFNVAQTGNYDFYVQGYDHLGGSAFNVELKETPANSKPNHLGLVNDFNKDGKNDILWRNYSTGENLAWALDGGTWINNLDIEDVTDPAWYIVGTGDFNNDGNTDILWRYHWEQNTGHNVVWLMNGNQHLANVDLDRVDDNYWHIVGTGDFTQDGNIDILWRNDLSGDNVIWSMKGTERNNDIPIEKQTDLNQRIVGTGDFNGDGKIDILWRNAATGTNSIWLMNGTSISSQVNFDSVTDLNWHIMGTADFNNDGKSDIIWRNYANGQNLAWLMDGNVHTGDFDITDIGDLNWNIVGKSNPVSIWTAQYFGNKDLSGTPTYTQGFTEVNGKFSLNWGLGAPPNTPADNFSARFKNERYLAPGLYKINLSSDDGVRVWIGNELIIDQWTDQSGNYSDYFTSSGAYYPVTIEYKENGGAAQLNYEIVKYQPYDNFGNPDGIINSWNATFFHWNGQGNPIMDDAHKIGTVNLGGNVRGDGQWGMNAQNWGSGSPAPNVPTDFFAMHAYTRKNLEAGHTYEVWVRSDDGYQIFAHKLGGGVFNITPDASNGVWQGGAYGNHVKWAFVAPESGTFDFKINMFEAVGDAYVDLVLKDVTAPPPPAYSPLITTQGAQYFKDRSQFYTTGNIFAQSHYGSSLVNGTGSTEGNCTWYAYGRVKELGGSTAALNSMSGNANKWHNQLSNGASIVGSNDVQFGDIAQWTRWYTDSSGNQRQMNHVAVVERVYVDGSGVKKVVVSESHYSTNYDGGGAGTLHRIFEYRADNPDRYIRVPRA